MAAAKQPGGRRSGGLLRWPVGVQGAAVGCGGGAGAVGVAGDRPAPSVNHDLVMEPAEQAEVSQAGRRLAGARRGFPAARPRGLPAGRPRGLPAVRLVPRASSAGRPPGLPPPSAWSSAAVRLAFLRSVRVVVRRAVRLAFPRPALVRLSCGPPAWLSRGPPARLSRGPPAWLSRGPSVWLSCGPSGWSSGGRPAWAWWWAVSQTVVSWSRTCQSIWPVTIVVSTASHAAASAAGPVRYADPGPAAALAGVQVRSSTEPAGGRRRPVRPVRSPRSMCMLRCGGCPSRPPIMCPLISRWQASSIASWRRCAAVRVSSGPAFCPKASKHHGQRRGARRGQVRVQPPGAAEGGAQPQRAFLEPVAVPCPGWPGRGRASPAPAAPDRADPRRPAPPRARSRPRPPGTPRGSWSVQSQISRASDTGTWPCASAAAITGCAASRRAHPAAAAAAPLVTRVIARSQDPGA